jgi:hypothetical protein
VSLLRILKEIPQLPVELELTELELSVTLSGSKSVGRSGAETQKIARYARTALRPDDVKSVWWTPHSLLDWYVDEWGVIQSVSEAEWCDLELAFLCKLYGASFCSFLSFALAARPPVDVAWHLYQRRVQEALSGSVFALSLILPRVNSHRLSLRGQYRFFGDGVYVARCFRPHCVVMVEGQSILRLDGEVKTN